MEGNVTGTNIQPTQTTDAVDTGKVVETGVTEDSGKETTDSGDGQVESFEKWMKKREESKPKVEKKPEAETKPVEKTPKIEPDTQTKADSTPKDTKPTETVNKAPEQVLKVGDKEYKPQDIEHLTKTVDDFKAREASTIQEIKGFVDTLKTDPGKILDKLQVSRELIEKYYFEKYLEPETLTPEQKLERVQKQLADREEADRQAAESQRIEQNRQFWAEKISTALKTEGLPETEWTVNRLAGYIKQARDKKIEISHGELAKLVHEDMVTSQRQALQGLNPEQLVQVLGEEGVAKFRKYETEKFKQTKFENTNPSKPGTVAPKEKKPTKKYSNAYDLLDDL